MNETSTDLPLTSKVFPSAEDIAAWEAMSPAEQRGFVERSEQAGFESGAAPDETVAERISRVRAARV